MICQSTALYWILTNGIPSRDAMALQFVQTSHVFLVQLKRKHIQIGSLSFWLDRFGQRDKALLQAPSYQNLYAGSTNAKLQSVNLAKDQVCHDDWMTAAQSMQAMFCKLDPISSYAVILSRSRAARVVSGESRSTGDLLCKRSTRMLPAFECGSCMTCCKAGTQREAVTARKLQYYTKLFMHTEKSLVHFQCRSLLAVCTARYVLC